LDITGINPLLDLHVLTQLSSLCFNKADSEFSYTLGTEEDFEQIAQLCNLTHIGSLNCCYSFLSSFPKLKSISLSGEACTDDLRKIFALENLTSIDIARVENKDLNGLDDPAFDGKEMVALIEILKENSNMRHLVFRLARYGRAQEFYVEFENGEIRESNFSKENVQDIDRFSLEKVVMK
jgi:hypothetical protein